jgi:glycosidase
MLRAPALEHPDSLTAQLEYIRRHWGYLLGDLVLRLLTGLDVLGEEAHARWMRANPADWERLRDSGPDAILKFERGEHEPERFSADRDWMPRVVLLAKSAYVWLDQLSRRYARDIRRLDQIPDEELDRLARWGINSVWLIGVWERSRASQRIKQLCGNPDAAASAYSLLDYRIADDLGGEPALRRLESLAAERGIRLASDMVPNHMGIDSRWVIEHPDWFLWLGDSPFPSYTFNGPDLSPDGRVAIQIEDHYYDRSDAAVVFKRTDRASGQARFIYHGNDGTSYPWNDTAQLDYTRPEVREGLIQTILHVARQFPVIRFDAAMTLAKRHYQRLWFPEPGTGGAIPSRAEHGMTRAQFDAAIPQEFWREVVDRVAAESPDTLLLAEAFWLMEGYFVRTLGMHRVYNSAFMNMLRDEQNANYRSVIKNTIEFDPEILKRYVNFMSNPDERTAVDQFGRGDKYFGVCTLMSTLPGLPMFGHGQVEGYEERYGMEYRRAYRDEQPDGELVGRHEREIFPLLHRRALFAEAREFRLYDFFGEDGHVNEDVFAYSNRRGDERGLVVYHNKWARAAGWIRESSAYAVAGGGGKRLERRTLGEALGLSMDEGAFCRFRDFAHGFEYLRRSRELCEQGFLRRSRRLSTPRVPRHARGARFGRASVGAARRGARGARRGEPRRGARRDPPPSARGAVPRAAGRREHRGARGQGDGRGDADVRSRRARGARAGIPRGGGGSRAGARRCGRARPSRAREHRRVARARRQAGERRRVAAVERAAHVDAARRLRHAALACRAGCHARDEPRAARGSRARVAPRPRGTRGARGTRTRSRRRARRDRASAGAARSRGRVRGRCTTPAAARARVQRLARQPRAAAAARRSHLRRCRMARAGSVRELARAHRSGNGRRGARDAGRAGTRPGDAEEFGHARRGATAPPSRDTWLATLAEHARRSGWRTERLLAPAQEAAGGSSPTGASSARP